MPLGAGTPALGPLLGTVTKVYATLVTLVVVVEPSCLIPPVGLGREDSDPAPAPPVGLEEGPEPEPEPDPSVAVTGHTVVYSGITSVVTEPRAGQLGTELGHEVMVYTVVE